VITDPVNCCIDRIASSEKMDLGSCIVPAGNAHAAYKSVQT